MNVLIAMDSMKGSLSSKEANTIISTVMEAHGFTTKSIQIADGGEGTLAAFLQINNGEKLSEKVYTPSGEETIAHYGWLEKDRIAIIEMAEASGLLKTTKNKGHPRLTSSYGTGQLIRKCLDLNPEKIIIGIGGSGTVDGGIGLLAALGVKFYDESHRTLKPIGGNLSSIHQIDLSDIDPRIKNKTIVIAADVAVPLTGSTGAVYQFGEQKGLAKAELAPYESSMNHFLSVSKGEETQVLGDGAAGGVGFALRHFLNGEIQSGFDCIAKHIHLEEEIKQADFVITGEGKIDKQTAFGKVPISIAKLAQKYDIPVIAIGGKVDNHLTSFEKQGIDVIFSTIDTTSTNVEALNNSQQNLTNAIDRICRLMKITQKIINK